MQKKTGKRKINAHELTQWLLLPLMIITLAFGWHFPIFGFIVPVVMITAILTGVFRGRYACGNFCPRGSFYDRIIFKISLNRPAPAFLSNIVFRWIVVVVLMGFMIFRLSHNISSWRHWGRTFWVMCIVTSAIGIVLGIFRKPRTWCSFCPIGTIGKALGQGKYQLKIDSNLCIMCKKCHTVCPVGIAPYEYKDNGVIIDNDCIKCGECIRACPTKALSFAASQITSTEKTL